jgi:hypothetical protein
MGDFVVAFGMGSVLQQKVNGKRITHIMTNILLRVNGMDISLIKSTPFPLLDVARGLLM